MLILKYNMEWCLHEYIFILKIPNGCLYLHGLCNGRGWECQADSPKAHLIQQQALLTIRKSYDKWSGIPNVNATEVSNCQAGSWVYFPHWNILWFHDNEYLRASSTKQNLLVLESVHVFIMLTMELCSGYITNFLSCSTCLYIANLSTMSSLSNQGCASNAFLGQWSMRNTYNILIYLVASTFLVNIWKNFVIVKMTLHVYEKQRRHKIFIRPSLNSFSLQMLLSIDWIFKKHGKIDILICLKTDYGYNCVHSICGDL